MKLFKAVLFSFLLLSAIQGNLFAQEGFTAAEPVLPDTMLKNDTNGTVYIKPYIEEKTLKTEVMTGDLEAVTQILKQGTDDINSINFSGYTALMFACSKGYVEIAGELLKAKADVNMFSHFDETALMIAMSHNNAKLAELLVNAGANLDAATGNGTTALMYAASLGSWEPLKVLLNAGANAYIANDDGKTALMFAFEEGYDEIVNIMLDYGVDVNDKTPKGDTILMFVASSGFSSHRTVLECKDASLFGCTFEKADPIFENQKNALIKIAAAKPDLNAQNNDGITALMYAAGYPDLTFEDKAAMVDILLNWGADFSIKDNEGRTALDYALKSKNKAAVKYLRAANKKANAEVKAKAKAEKAEAKAQAKSAKAQK